MDGIRETLDMRGKSITTFIVFDAARRLEDMREGEILELVTDVSEPIERDIRSWCEVTGHVLESAEKDADRERYLIRKGRPRPTARTMAMVISNPGLEELLSPLGFAQAAALEGIELHIFFQGPAVRVLQRGFKPRLRGWARPFTRFAVRGLAKAGHISPQEKLQQLRDLGSHLYVCGPSMEHFKVPKDDLIFEDLPIIEYLSFMAKMEETDINLYVQ